MASAPKTASAPKLLQLSTPETFDCKARELMAISDTRPGEVGKKPLGFEALNLDEGLMKTICQAVTSSTLARAEALEDLLLNDNMS